MEQKIIDEAKSIFEISKKSGITDDFESLFDHDYLSKFPSNLKKIKETALRARFGVTFDESIWDDSFEVRKKLTWHLIEYALEHQKAIMLDWRASAEDTVFNVRQILPETEIKGLGEKQVNGDWIEEIEVGDRLCELKIEDDELMIDRVIREINKYLEIRFNVLLLTTKIGYDDHYFLLVKKSTMDGFEDLGFFLP